MHVLAVGQGHRNPSRRRSRWVRAGPFRSAGAIDQRMPDGGGRATCSRQHAFPHRRTRVGLSSPQEHQRNDPGGPPMNWRALAGVRDEEQRSPDHGQDNGSTEGRHAPDRMAQGNFHGAQRRPSDPAHEHQARAHPCEKPKVRGSANCWHWFLGALNSIGPECPRSDLQRTCWPLPNSRLTYVQREISRSTAETMWGGTMVSPPPRRSNPEILEFHAAASEWRRPLRPSGNRGKVVDPRRGSSVLGRPRRPTTSVWVGARAPAGSDGGGGDCDRRGPAP